MAITNGTATVGTVASAIDGIWPNPSRIIIHNKDNTDAVYLGGSAVTTTNGVALNKLETLQFDLEPLDQIFVVSTKSNHAVSWMRQTL